MPDITANGIQIHYERTGGAKPPVVLLHGVTDSGACWPRVVAALKGDYDVLTFDARGHGLSSAPASFYPQALADDAAGAIKALGLTKPAIIGHSMGWATAAILGAAYPDLPGRLVLEDPPFRGAESGNTDNTADAKFWHDLITVFKGKTLEQIIAGFNKNDARSREWTKLWDKSEWAPWYESKQQVSVNVSLLMATPAPNWQTIVPRIACPTLLVTGDPAKGSIVTAAAAARAAELNPRLKVVNCPDAGHNIRRESFAEFMAAVKAFLKSA